jgi:hypothetical protein
VSPGGLRQCPRCRNWTADPDHPDGHITGAVGTWQGGGPLPPIRYCTPYGPEVRALEPPPPLPPTRWTANGYRRVGGKVVD